MPGGEGSYQLPSGRLTSRVVYTECMYTRSSKREM